MAQKLTGKDALAFKEVMKLYDDKQYKRAVKAADTLLVRIGDHSETLGLKGLILSQMPGHKEEAYLTIKKGIRADMK